MTESKPLTLYQIACEVVKENDSVEACAEAIAEFGSPRRVKALKEAEERYREWCTKLSNALCTADGIPLHPGTHSVSIVVWCFSDAFDCFDEWYSVVTFNQSYFANRTGNPWTAITVSEVISLDEAIVDGGYSLVKGNRAP